MRHSIFARHLRQNLGGSARVGAVYFPDHRKPTVVVCYQEIGSRLKLEEISLKVLEELHGATVSHIAGSSKTSGTLHNPVLPVVNLRLFLARILLLGLLVASSQNQNDPCG